MLYYLFQWLDKMNLPGAGMFQYISFRAATAIILSLVISLLIGKYLITLLKRKQIEETIRELNLPNEEQKKGTPTMGGIIIIAAVLIPVLLLTKLTNIYIILMIFTTIWLGILGFLDDYIKVYKKKKAGLPGKIKVIGQVILGLIVGIVIFFHPDVVIKENVKAPVNYVKTNQVFAFENMDNTTSSYSQSKAEHSTKTTIPFIKNNEFDYAWFTRWLGDEDGHWAFLFYIPIVIFIIVAVSNGANLTDGLDGLASGTSAVIAVSIAVLAYVSGNTIFANYLNIMYIPNIGEVVIFVAAFIGACIGFYWWNCYPAKIFMGDTGSLTLGGIIAVLCIIIRKELLIPILCGIFLIQSISVIIQVAYFKYAKKRYGYDYACSHRVFKMTPLHHHYQKKGIHEAQIVQRFIICGILLAILSIVTLKIR